MEAIHTKMKGIGVLFSLIVVFTMSAFFIKINTFANKEKEDYYKELEDRKVRDEQYKKQTEDFEKVIEKSHKMLIKDSLCEFNTKTISKAQGLDANVFYYCKMVNNGSINDDPVRIKDCLCDIEDFGKMALSIDVENQFKEIDNSTIDRYRNKDFQSVIYNSIGAQVIECHNKKINSIPAAEIITTKYQIGSFSKSLITTIFYKSFILTISYTLNYNNRRLVEDQFNLYRDKLTKIINKTKLNN